MTKYSSYARIAGAVVVALAVTIVLSGCLESRTVVNVGADGSGTVEETFLMQEQILQMLGSMGGGEGFSLLDRNELESGVSDYGEGVSLQSAQEVKTDWGSGYRAVYAFEDVNQLRVNQNPSDELPSQGAQMGQEQPRADEYIRFSMTRGRPNTLEIIMPEQDDVETESPNEPQGNDGTEMGDFPQEEMEGIVQMYRDMRISVDVVVDGEIVETNAAHAEGNTVTLLDLNFNKIIERPEVLEQLASRRAETITEVQETVNEVPGIKAELKPRVEVQFR